jgi:prevent-host-death family protein
MIEQDPATRTMKISDVKARLSSLVNEVYRRETRVLVEKAGIPVAALVSIEDLERLTRLDREWAAGTRALQEVSAAFRDVPVAELEERVAQIIAEGRARDEAEQGNIAKRNARFLVVDQMREAFKDVPPEEIERNVVAIIREMREANEATRSSEEQVAPERRPA